MISKSDFDITEAIRFFNKYSVEASYLVPTAVGLGKAIMDATSPLRSYLKAKSIRNYDGQLQGPAGKKILRAFFVTETNLIPTTVSLYRPHAKGRDGDPRIWFSKLTSYAQPNNLLGIIAFDDSLYVVNVSNENVRNSAESSGSPLSNLLKKITSSQDSVATELLSKMQEVAARGWIKTVTNGDTGIGATLEECLGIPINSSRTPDYKGIEIKTKRVRGLKPSTRSTLFAQVPDWSISKLKSSAEILDAYGYFRGDIKKLYCTVSSSAPNPQGLMLQVDESKDLLREVFRSNDRTEDVVLWRFDTLRERLLTKHNETFWVGAESKPIAGIEHFQYKKIIHTRLPYASNFHTLCHEGVVTLDHLIKRSEDGRVSEKGPLFKINERNFDLLFPPPLLYDLSTLSY